jgi:hypothetical protein
MPNEVIVTAGDLHRVHLEVEEQLRGAETVVASMNPELVLYAGEVASETDPIPVPPKSRTCLWGEGITTPGTIRVRAGDLLRSIGAMRTALHELALLTARMDPEEILYPADNPDPIPEPLPKGHMCLLMSRDNLGA